LFWEYEFGIWKQGPAIGILGIHVLNFRDSVAIKRFTATKFSFSSVTEEDA
jgi:hypothetical protein